MEHKQVELVLIEAHSSVLTYFCSGTVGTYASSVGAESLCVLLIFFVCLFVLVMLH